MSPSKNEQASVLRPESHLYEFDDYANDDEIHDVVVAKLKEAGLYKPDLLVVGYAQPETFDPNRASRDEAKTHAFTMEAWEKALKIGDDLHTPTFYAVDSNDPDTKMAIGVYDPELLKEVGANVYRHPEGLPVDEAKLATFFIEREK